jgi:hypothetical protein
MTLEKSAYEQALKQGLVHDFSFPIKKEGAYHLRVALRDHGNDKLGSANQFVEVPNLKKNRLVLSGVALENLEYAEWQKRAAGQPSRSETADALDALVATSLRQFKRGTVLNYGFSVYNAKRVGSARNLSYQTRIFRDGKTIFETEAQPVPAGNADQASLDFSGSLALGTSMAPGDYVLQIVIIDNLAKASRNTASQFVQFEIIE